MKLPPKKIELTFERLPDGKAKLHYEEIFDERFRGVMENTVEIVKRSFADKFPSMNVRVEGNSIILDSTDERQALAFAMVGEFLEQAVENERDVLIHINTVASSFLKMGIARELKPDDLKVPEMSPEEQRMTVREYIDQSPSRDPLDKMEVENTKLLVEKGVISMDDTLKTASEKLIEYNRKLLGG